MHVPSTYLTWIFLLSRYTRLGTSYLFKQRTKQTNLTQWHKNRIKIILRHVKQKKNASTRDSCILALNVTTALITNDAQSTTRGYFTCLWSPSRKKIGDYTSSQLPHSLHGHVLILRFLHGDIQRLLKLNSHHIIPTCETDPLQIDPQLRARLQQSQLLVGLLVGLLAQIDPRSRDSTQH